MADLTLNEAVEQTLAVIREGFEGPPEKWSYFTDHGPEGGRFGLKGFFRPDGWVYAPPDHRNFKRIFQF